MEERTRKPLPAWLPLLCVAVLLVAGLLYLNYTRQEPRLVAVEQGELLYYKGKQLYRYDPVTEQSTKTQPEYSYRGGVLYRNGEEWLKLPDAPKKAHAVVAVPQAGQVNLIFWEKEATTRTRYIIDVTTGEFTVEQLDVPQYGNWKEPDPMHRAMQMNRGWRACVAGAHLLEEFEYKLTAPKGSQLRRGYFSDYFLDGEMFSFPNYVMLAGSRNGLVLQFVEHPEAIPEGERGELPQTYRLWDGEQAVDMPEGYPLAWNDELYLYYNEEDALCCYQLDRQSATEWEVQGDARYQPHPYGQTAMDGKRIYHYNDIGDDAATACYEILYDETGAAYGIALRGMVD